MIAYVRTEECTYGWKKNMFMLHWTDKFKFYCQFPKVIFLTKRKLLYCEDFGELKTSTVNLARERGGGGGGAGQGGNIEEMGKMQNLPLENLLWQAPLALRCSWFWMLLLKVESAYLWLPKMNENKWKIMVCFTVELLWLMQ